MMKITYRPRRQFRRLLFIFSWAIFICSLLGPATAEHTIFTPHGPNPVLFFVLGSPLALVPTRISDLPGSCFAWATLVFAATPLATYATDYWPRLARLVFLSPALLVWVVLVDSWRPGQAQVLWGYYLIASAYTLSYFAAQINPAASPRAGRHRGFPVIIDKPSGTDENRAGGPEQEGHA